MNSGSTFPRALAHNVASRPSPQAFPMSTAVFGPASEGSWIVRNHLLGYGMYSLVASAPKEPANPKGLDRVVVKAAVSGRRSTVGVDKPSTDDKNVPIDLDFASHNLTHNSTGEEVN